MGVATIPAQRSLSKTPAGRHFWICLLLLVAGAILRSGIATRLDDFTMDEAYHIAAGASYVQRGDFRMNPEHPPLVKLWVGSFMTVTGFHLSPFRHFNDKHDERKFAEEDVYYRNDADSVQRRARRAMWGLNGLLLVILATALRQAFSSAVALGTVLFLAIDPTVAAHLPVVMTDLPLGVLSVTTVVVATVAFRTWAWRDVLWCSLMLGLTLGAKHTALVFTIALGLAGSVLAILPSQSDKSRLNRLGKVGVVLLGALSVLWGLYFFRFQEGGSRDEVFNRPLQDKIADLNFGTHRFALRHLNAVHVVPRAYVWGLADAVRAGLEGRAESQLAFGRLFYNKAPWYFFPGTIAVKVPIGLSLLSLVGVAFFLLRRLPHEWGTATITLVAAAFFFFLVLSRGATYAGVRHATPLLVVWAVFGGFAAHAILGQSSRVLKGFAGLAFSAAVASATPAMRPWEYYNELVGGAANAYQYFDDEGVDLGQRGKEMIRYYHEVVQPSGEIPYIDVESTAELERSKYGLDWVGRDPKRDAERMASPIWSGTVIAEARLLSRELWWDAPELRAATPVVRFGNLMIFHGQFRVPGKQAFDRYLDARDKMFSHPPDYKAAEALLQQSVTADPRPFFVYIALGNVRLGLGSREGALQAYKTALQRLPDDRDMRRAIEQQIERVSTGNLDQIPPLRDPELE